MLRGLYTAVSAMQTTEKRIDVISNNMANVNTTGFKRDVVVTETFPEVLLHKINGKLPVETFDYTAGVSAVREGEAYQLTADNGFFAAQTPNGTSYNRETYFAVDPEGYLRTYSRDIDGNIDTTYGYLILDNGGNPVNVGQQPFEISPGGQVVVNGQAIANLLTRGGPNVIGTINGGLRLNMIEANYSQGGLEETGNPLHFAIKGRGFFQVMNQQGERFYTRDGAFTLNDAGEIINSEGYYLLNEQGWSIPVAGQDFILSEQGEILVNGQVVDRVALIDIVNERDIRKHGEGHYYMAPNTEAEIRPFQGEVFQGYLEASNVNPIREMVEMISAYRTYESNQKVVRAYDEILQRAVNDIGKV
ncbi:flagellar hook-basal body protein [Alkaliphilus crotonatoxidans]